jgi:hypothetical protein
VQPPSRFGDSHSFTGAGSDEVGFEFGDHRENVEQKSSNGIVGIVRGATDAEAYALRCELVDDVFSVAERACEPVEFRDDQSVAVPARRQSFSKSGPGPVGAGKSVIGVDQLWSHS